ncbi:type II secretion system protein GspE [bacterium]|nr:type II secretion system protein GspE [bacterium]|tara:strand:- start:238 stop:1929 length:1692 start_codon:yes stop_codon:yes gene_type:complete
MDSKKIKAASGGKRVKSKDDKQTGLDLSNKINLEIQEEIVKKKAEALGNKYGYINLISTPINADLYDFWDLKELKEGLVIPFFRVGSKVRVAINDPNFSKTKEVLEKMKKEGFELQLNLASRIGILYQLKKFTEGKIKDDKIENIVDEDLIETYQKEIETLSKLGESISLSTLSKGINDLLVGGLKTKASDIHLQPQEEKTLVRFRIDGMLQKVLEFDNKIYKELAKQIKYKSGLRLNVNDIPQDGRLFFEVNEYKIDVRVSTIPTEFGETIVLRLLDSRKKFLDLEHLGFNERDLSILNDISDLSQGMILVTGPTGSGKTTTLYSLLARYNTSDRKIITLEDPIEYHLDRIVQSQINEKKGYTFQMALESVLRQDPDVVMIGEIRDLETANTALQASLTGHVMLSTLHTNSALEAIPRLRNMGLEPYLIAPSLDTVMAQRLVRKFCEHCVEEKEINEKDLGILKAESEKISKITKKPYNIPSKLPCAKGCEKCNHTGYLGRIVICEIFRIDQEFRDAITEDVPFSKLLQKAQKEGMLTMYQDGILKVIDGHTSLSEVLRVTK